MLPSKTLNVNALLSLDITDPTDFPPPAIAPGLRQIDSALRCQICRELIEAPVTLQCGHCFCSLCIRSTLADKQECPSCRKSANEGHLRPNPVMEEIVTSWMEARPFMLRLSKSEERRLTRLKSNEQESSPKKSKESGTKRKRSADSSRSSTILETPSKPGPSRTTQARPGSKTIPNSGKLEFEDEDSLDDLDAVPTSDSREEELSRFTGKRSSLRHGNAVNCPMCHRQVKLETINTHIDNGCPSPPASDAESYGEHRSKKSEWSRILGGPKHPDKRKGRERPLSPAGQDRLPKAAYTVLKDKQLKILLAEQGLPVIGDRSAMIARHQRWVMIYNGNLDRSINQRRTIQDLRTELKKWERDRKVKKNIVNDVDAYQKAHKSEFAHLIEAARPKKIPEPNKILERTPVSPSSATDADDDVIVVDSEEERLLR